MNPQEWWALLAAMPERLPASFICAPDVYPSSFGETMRHVWRSNDFANVPIYVEEGLRPGEWRLLDQHGDIMKMGNLNQLTSG